VEPPTPATALFAFPTDDHTRPPLVVSPHCAGGGDPRVISDCHFRKTATEYDRKNGLKWLSCTEK
jgi:hypothetical protein